MPAARLPQHVHHACRHTLLGCVVVAGGSYGLMPLTILKQLTNLQCDDMLVAQHEGHYTKKWSPLMLANKVRRCVGAR